MSKNFENPISAAFSEDARFYFVHSFHMCEERKTKTFKRILWREILHSWRSERECFGFSVSPRKSHRFGMELFKFFQLETN